MTHDETVEEGARRRAADTAILLLQAAASVAEIGSFARQGLETPRRATAHYAARAAVAGSGGGGLRIR